MSERSGFAKFFGQNPAPVEAVVETEAKAEIDETQAYEGQLAIDVYETPAEIVIKAPIAGVRPEDLDLLITDDVITIRGQRKKTEGVSEESYLCQECYWGSFSRSYILPVAVDADSAKAALKDGVLSVTIPKEAKSKTRVVPISET